MKKLSGEAAAFTHYDQIASVKPGQHLMVCEPIGALNVREGGVMDVPQGTTLRVTCTVNSIEAQAFIGGKIRTVKIRSDDYTSLEVAHSGAARTSQPPLG